MKKVFQLLVVAAVVIHVVWAPLPGLENPLFEWMAIGLWIPIGAGLVAFVPVARFFYLLTILWLLIVIAGATDYLSILEPFSYYERASIPATDTIENFSLLLDGIVLLMSYVTPLAYEFDAYLEHRKPTTRSLKFTIISSDGAMLAFLTAIALTVLVYMQFVIGALHFDNLLSTQVEQEQGELKTAQASDDKEDMAASFLQLGFLYEYQGNSEKATTMYENALALREAGVTVNDEDAPTSALARIYANEPDDRFEDGEKALAMAERAVNLGSEFGYVNHRQLNALATVYARRGQFDKAAQNQLSAITNCMSNTLRCPPLYEYYGQLQAYREGKLPDEEYQVSNP